MKLIFISGPSGSGKTTLSKNILGKIKNGFVLNTDNYYKTGIISKLLSLVVDGYFDRRISFNYKLFKKDFGLIIMNCSTNYKLLYNYKDKTIKKFKFKTKNIKYLIIEGIFASEFTRTIYKNDCFFIELRKSKNYCMNKAIKRDVKERGKSKTHAKNDFLRSWDIYYDRFKNNSFKKNTKGFVLIKNTNIDQILKKILN